MKSTSFLKTPLNVIEAISLTSAVLLVSGYFFSVGQSTILTGMFLNAQTPLDHILNSPFAVFIGALMTFILVFLNTAMYSFIQEFHEGVTKTRLPTFREKAWHILKHSTVFILPFGMIFITGTIFWLKLSIWVLTLLIIPMGLYFLTRKMRLNNLEEQVPNDDYKPMKSFDKVVLRLESLVIIFVVFSLAMILVGRFWIMSKTQGPENVEYILTTLEPRKVTTARYVASSSNMIAFWKDGLPILEKRSDVCCIRAIRPETDFKETK